MSKQVHLKVLFDVATDLGELWTKVRDFKGIHLGGENSKYAVRFDGDYESSLKVLDVCMRCANNGQFFADFYNT